MYLYNCIQIYNKIYLITGELHPWPRAYYEVLLLLYKGFCWVQLTLAVFFGLVLPPELELLLFFF